MRLNALKNWQRLKMGLNHTVYGLSGTVFNFVFSLIIVRQYSAQLWGSFAQLMLMMTFLSQITSWGNKDYLLREFSRNNQHPFLWQTSFLSRIAISIPLLPLFFIPGFTQNEPLLFGIWCLTNFFLRSFDSVIVFERKFKHAITIELFGFLVVIVLLLFAPKDISFHTLIMLFILSTFIKILLYLPIVKQPFLELFCGTFSRQYLLLSIPYFLPPFISFLNAKADTFAIALTLSEQELGKYYVLVSLVSYCQAIAALALVPFLKNIYRIKLGSFLKIKKIFFLGGMVWSVLCMVSIYVIIEFIYLIHFGTYIYIVAALALPPFFIYYLIAQDFFRHDNPYPAVIINLIAAILNFMVSLLLIDSFGFMGGLLSFAAMQWVLLTGFLVWNKIGRRNAVDSPFPRIKIMSF